MMWVKQGRWWWNISSQAIYVAMKDTGTLAGVWLVIKLHTSNRKWHREGKQEVWGRAVMLFHCVFFPVRSHSLTRCGRTPGRERKGRGKGVRESEQGILGIPPSHPPRWLCPQTLNCFELLSTFKMLTQTSCCIVSDVWGCGDLQEGLNSDAFMLQAASCWQMLSVLLLLVLKALVFKIVCDTSAHLLLDFFHSVDRNMPPMG